MVKSLFFVGMSAGLLVASMAHASDASTTASEGYFSKTHLVIMSGYRDRASCEEDGFRWQGRVCATDGEDSAEVTSIGGHLNLEVMTITDNAHTCDFSAPAQKISDTELKASSDGCEVTVTYDHSDAVRVSNNGKCDSFCGINAYLEIDGAARRIRTKS